MGILIRSRTPSAYEPDSEHNIWDTTAVWGGSWRCITQEETPMLATSGEPNWQRQLVLCPQTLTVSISLSLQQLDIDIIILH